MTDNHDAFDNPLEESALDMGEMRVLSVLPNDVDDPTFAFISLIEPERAQKKLAAVKPAAATENRMRVDRSRARKPESGIITTSAIR